jgi:hypothetical protein
VFLFIMSICTPNIHANVSADMDAYVRVRVRIECDLVVTARLPRHNRERQRGNSPPPFLLVILLCVDRRVDNQILFPERSPHCRFRHHRKRVPYVYANVSVCICVYVCRCVCVCACALVYASAPAPNQTATRWRHEIPVLSLYCL